MYQKDELLSVICAIFLLPGDVTHHSSLSYQVPGNISPITCDRSHLYICEVSPHSIHVMNWSGQEVSILSLPGMVDGRDWLYDVWMTEQGILHAQVGEAGIDELIAYKVSSNH